VTSQVPVEKTRSTPDGDTFPAPRTESPRVITDPASEAPTGPLTIVGADDAAVRGVDEILGREVRLVTLPPADGEVLSERIEQVRHLARLHHPHLLEVYDVDGLSPDTESTLVLENVPGEPLALVLRDGPIGEPELARMGAQLASALAHAHAHGVEHGAIGAASILVDRAHADAWLVGLTASLSGPLPVVGEAPDDGEDAARRRAADVRALAAILTEVVEHAAATVGGDDPEAVTRPTARDDAAPASPLVALLRDVESDPPSAAVFSEQLVRVGRGVAVREGRPEPARLVPVVASFSESRPRFGSPEVEAPSGPEIPAALAGPAVRARKITPFGVTPAAGRRARRAGVLGAATATLALASGLVIWAGESHLGFPESQAEIGASAPSTIPAAPALPQSTDASGDSGGSGGGGTWTGETAGSTGGTERTVVGVTARQAAVREAAPSSTSSGTTQRHPETGTRSDPPPRQSPDPRPTRPDPSSTAPPTTPRSTPPTTDPTKPTTSRSTPTRRTGTAAPTTSASSTATSTATDPTKATTDPTKTASDPTKSTSGATKVTTPDADEDAASTATPTATPTATVLAAGM
jgi:hypothetical protein